MSTLPSDSESDDLDSVDGLDLALDLDLEDQERMAMEQVKLRLETNLKHHRVQYFGCYDDCDHPFEMSDSKKLVLVCGVQYNKRRDDGIPVAFQCRFTIVAAPGHVEVPVGPFHELYSASGGEVEPVDISMQEKAVVEKQEAVFGPSAEVEFLSQTRVLQGSKFFVMVELYPLEVDGFDFILPDHVSPFHSQIFRFDEDWYMEDYGFIFFNLTNAMDVMLKVIPECDLRTYLSKGC